MKGNKYIIIISDRRKVTIRKSTILYVCSRRKYLEVHVSEHEYKIYKTIMSLEEMEKELGKGFVKVQRGCIVSERAIDRVADKIYLVNGEELKYTVRNKKEIVENLRLNPKLQINKPGRGVYQIMNPGVFKAPNKGNTVGMNKDDSNRIEEDWVTEQSDSDEKQEGCLIQPVLGTNGYEVNDNKITLKGTYLDTLPVGEYTITVSYNPLGVENYTPWPDEDKLKDTTFTLTVKVAENAPIVEDEKDQGWDAIKNKILEILKNGSTGDTQVITIDMNGTTVPRDIFEVIKDKDIIIELNMGNGVKWTINGKDVANVPKGEIDFGVEIDTNNIPVDVLNKVTGERYKIQIRLKHNGAFGFKAVLTVNLKPENAGYYANLFYYNEQIKDLEFMSYGIIGAEGNVNLDFVHASDYVIIIDDKSLDGSVKEPTPESTQTPTTTSTKISSAQLSKNSLKLGLVVGCRNSEFKLSWGTVKGADDYDIYATLCGKTLNAKTLNKSVDAKKTSATLKRIAGNKIFNTKKYKVQIRAYKLIDGKKVYLGKSRDCHVAGDQHKEYTNAKSVNVTKESVTLKTGITTKIRATIKKESKSKKLLPIGHGPALGYYTPNKKIATNIMEVLLCMTLKNEKKRVYVEIVQKILIINGKIKNTSIFRLKQNYNIY